MDIDTDLLYYLQDIMYNNFKLFKDNLISKREYDIRLEEIMFFIREKRQKEKD
jgi:hypothetical protein